MALEAAAEEIRREGGTALAIPTDVADPEQVDAAAERVERELGPIDVWVNDAMASVFARVRDIEPTRIQARDRGDLPGLGLRHDGRPSSACARATAARSSRSGRRSPTAASRCSRPTAAPSTRIKGFTESLRTELMQRAATCT